MMQKIALTLFSLLLVTSLAKAQNNYNNYNQFFSYALFTSTTVSGGGGIDVSISDDQLIVVFNASFASATLKQGQIVQLATTPQLPDISLGLISEGFYSASIENGWLSLGRGPDNIITNVTYFGMPGNSTVTYTFDLSGYLPQIPAHDNNYNYVSQSTIIKEGVQTRNEALSLSTQHRRVATGYLDGLGRDVQAVQAGGSPFGEDLITPVEYDASGRASKGYLPYTKAQNIGSYDAGWQAAQQAFYSGTPGIAQDTKPYTYTNQEDSPLNRTLSVTGAGQVWHGAGNNLTDDKATRQDYQVNTAADQVLYWEVDAAGKPFFKDYYAPGTLQKLRTTDENGNTIEVYTDLAGRKVLKRAFESGLRVQTYMVYNDLGQLSYVMQPALWDNYYSRPTQSPPNATYLTTATNLAVQHDGTDYFIKEDASLTLDPGFEYQPASGQDFIAQVKNINYPAATLLDQYAFQYQYDGRDRMTAKRVPGADWVYMIYDQWDRLVLTQDGNLRTNNQYLYTKYDALDRPIVTGLATLTGDIQTVRDAVMASTVRYENKDQAQAHDYTLNLTYPAFAEIDEMLSVNYYDDYAFDFAGTNPFEPAMGYTASDVFTRVKGLTTGNKTKVLGSSNTYIESVTRYDEYGRPIQVISTNTVGGKDRLTSLYNFAGETTGTELVHNSNKQPNAVTVKETFNHDPTGRILRMTHQVDNGPVITLVENEYNALGQLTDKYLHNRWQSIDYDYNIRGWITAIGEAGNAEIPFKMELNYTNAPLTGASPQYNGNIAEISWKQLGEDQLAYGYGYDQFSRLESASFLNNSTAGQAGHYDVAITSYDRNGNIQGLNRQHQGQSMDQLSYTYSGNQLLRVSDAGNQEGFKDGSNTGNDYAYDPNGNMVLDENKGISSITYNHLNLPAVVSLSNGQEVRYSYDAAGIKLARSLYESGSLVKHTGYAGSFIYENDSLQFLLHAEGRYLWEEQQYEYFIKDHLGNTRAVIHQPESWTVTATMETSNPAQKALEESEFAKVAETRHLDASIARNGQYVSRLNATGNALGPVKTMRVNKGDQVQATAYALYLQASTNTFPFNVGVYIANNYDHSNSENLLGNLSLGLAITGTGSTPPAGVPLAYLRAFVYDKDSMVVGYFEDLISASANSGWEALNLDIPINQDGFVKVYVMNEDDEDVFFDDISITYTESPILQLTDYYPFGLEIAGTAYNRHTWQANQYGYNGKEKETDAVLNWLDYGARMYMPEIGRWNGVDALAEDYLPISAYAYVANNPIMYIDPDGRRILVGDNAYEYVEGRDFEAIEDEYEKEIYRALDFLYSSGAMILTIGEGESKEEINVLQTLIDDEDNSIAIFPTNNSPRYDDKRKEVKFNLTEGTVFIKDHNTPVGPSNFGFTSPAGDLAHELIHAYNHLYDPEYYDRSNDESTLGQILSTEGYDLSYTDAEEKYTTEIANQVLKRIGNDLRTNYYGEGFPAESVISNRRANENNKRSNKNGN